MNHLFCSWGFGWVDKAQSSDRLAIGAVGSSPDFKSRVFHDIWLLGICIETLFHLPQTIQTLPNNSTLQHHPCSTHVFQMFSALKTVSWNSRLHEVWHFRHEHKIFGHPKCLWQLKKIIKFWGIRHLEFNIFWGSSPRPPQNVTSLLIPWLRAWGHVKMQNLPCNTPLILVFWPHPEPL